MAGKEKFEVSPEFLADLMTEVKKELDGLAKSEVAKLSKADDAEKPEITPVDNMSDGKETAEAPAPDLNDDGKIGDLAGKPEAPNDKNNGAEVKDEAPPMAADQEMSKSPEEQTPGEISPSPSIEVLQAEYSELDDEDLHNHFLAAKAAICARMGMDDEPEEEMEAAPMEPVAPAPAPEAAPMAPEMAKSDPLGTKGTDTPPTIAPTAPSKAPSVPAAPPVGDMKKSEGDYEALKKELDEAKEVISKQEQSMLDLANKLTTPFRKSVKGISELGYVGKTELEDSAPKLSKEAAIEKLREKAKDRSLKKSDRDLINSYSMGNIDYKQIAHLLTEVK